ncbi:MAG TPA: hypothetical protein VGF91_22290 [Solirubrobacteraceae bacterium]|jgi:hypothetical protein
MNCPRCGLSVRLVAPYMLVERCPRCLAHRRHIVAMYVTATFPPHPLSPPDRTKLSGPGSGRPAGADLSV